MIEDFITPDQLYTSDCHENVKCITNLVTFEFIFNINGKISDLNNFPERLGIFPESDEELKIYDWLKNYTKFDLERQCPNIVNHSRDLKRIDEKIDEKLSYTPIWVGAGLSVITGDLIYLNLGGMYLISKQIFKFDKFIRDRRAIAKKVLEDPLNINLVPTTNMASKKLYELKVPETYLKYI